MSGKPYCGTYEFRNGERLNTSHPIFVGSKPEYFVFIITPILTIFSQINEVIYTKNRDIPIACRYHYCGGSFDYLSYEMEYQLEQ
jgi:hypothetical protein